MHSAALLDTVTDTTERDASIAEDLACDGADDEYLRLVQEIESAGPCYSYGSIPASLQGFEPPF